MNVSCAAGLEVARTVIMADERRGIKGQKGKDLVNSADESRTDGARGERFDAQATDHRCVANIQRWHAGQRQHGRNGEPKNVLQVRWVWPVLSVETCCVGSHRQKSQRMR